MEQPSRNTNPKSHWSFFSKTSGFIARPRPFTVRRRRRARLISLLACLAIAAQSLYEASGWPLVGQASEPRQSDQAAAQRAPLKPATPSPYLIETLIDINEDIDLKRIWQMLNLAPPSAAAYKCKGDCEAEIFDLAASDEDHKKTIALRISYEKSHFYQYLVFKQRASAASNEGDWELLGNIDCLDQRDAPPSQRIEQGDGRTWLVIKELWKHGPALAAYGEVWIEIQEHALKRVLAYPVEGHHRPCQGQPGRSLQSLLLRHDLDNGDYTIPIQFMVAYEIANCDRPEASLALFAKGAKAYYVWNAEQGRFILDEARSGVTEKQIAGFSGAQGFSDAAFVEDNFQELAEIAANGDARRKSWLKTFLAGLPNTPRKADLQRRLQP
jgi:hypothetical protein